MTNGLVALVIGLFATALHAVEVTSFTLINADTDTPIAAFDPLVEGASFALTDLPTPNLSVRANVDGMVGSVSFALTGADSETRTENAAPYALFGDTNGDYKAWTPPLGSYALVARSHTEANGGGTAGVDLTISFEITGDDDTPPDGDGSVTVTGALMQWHRITVELSGPGATETSVPHPFLDHRYNVRFVGPSGQVRDVPGYFAGDGDDSGEGTVASGTVWRAHLAPDEVGTWTYAVSFRVGTEVAVDITGTQGAPLAPFDGATGSFVVGASNKRGDDFRAPGRGLIANRGGHYLSEADGDPWIKGGPNIPENFLGFVGFDSTPDAGHSFAAHDADWMPGGETYVLAELGNVYAVYNDRSGGPLMLDLSAADPGDTFDVRWFDPRTGVLDTGDVTTVSGGAVADLGASPHTPGDDWACLVVRQTATLFMDDFEQGDTSAWTITVP